MQALYYFLGQTQNSGGRRSLVFGPDTPQEQHINVTILEDIRVESNESLLLNLTSQDASVDIFTATSQLVILDNDSEQKQDNKCSVMTMYVST